jgi:hypothetical protein
MQLTESVEQALALSFTTMYAFCMVCVLRLCVQLRDPRRLLHLTYVTSIASTDFFSDLLYVTTQTFATPLLFGAACFFALAPTIVYLAVTGTLRSFFVSMIPSCLSFSLYGMKIVFIRISAEDEPRPHSSKSSLALILYKSGIVIRQALKFCGMSTDGGPHPLLLVQIARMSGGMIRSAWDQLKVDFKCSASDGYMCSEGSILELVFIILKVALLYVPRFTLALLIAVGSLILGFGACLLLITGTPMFSAAIFAVGLILGSLWCLVHVNFKLSVFASATKKLHSFMLHDPPDDETIMDTRWTRLLNLSFLAEIVFEDCPQLCIVCLNERWLSPGRDRNDKVIVWYSIGSSVLNITSNLYLFLFWSIKFCSINMAIDEVIYPVSDEQREHIRRRRRTLGASRRSLPDLRDLHKQKWHQGTAPATPPSSRSSSSAESPPSRSQSTAATPPSPTSSMRPPSPHILPPPDTAYRL